MAKQATPAEPAADKATAKNVFVVSPIGTKGTETRQDADYAMKFVFRRALQEPEWELHRADEGKSPDSIGASVITSIHDADLVIADLTGHNPNVFYELAFAHGWKKPVVHVAQEGVGIPFDVVDQRTIFYDLKDLESVEAAIYTLREAAANAVGNKDFVNPFTTFEAFQTLRNQGESNVSAESSENAISYLLEDISRKLTAMDNRLARVEKRDGGTINFRRDTPLTETSTYIIEVTGDGKIRIKPRTESQSLFDRERPSPHIPPNI